ncbi:erythromycin esterase family protein [Dactylosporangium sp. CA-139114]|uniref:erythromycin esterase family protein n=1 Tax=Dactylosporangium sp. CA-139114 TaxID=3239931 RepID=UPI003D973B43
MTFVPESCELLAFGEPTHLEDAVPRRRNELFAELAGRGFRTIALEIDRVAAMLVDDYVRDGVGDLDTVLRDGFSHGWGRLAANRELVVWMREHNAARPPHERLSLQGFDAPTENMSAPSPRGHLEHARGYLGLDLDLDRLAGDDERWSRTEAVLDPAQSPGSGPEAAELRTIAEQMWTELHMRAPSLIAATSTAAWRRARTQLTGGMQLLRYHRACSIPGLDHSVRVSRLMAVRDVLIAENILDLRDTPALLYGHNLHLRRGPSRWTIGELELSWSGAGSIVAPLLGARYQVIAGSLGTSAVKGLGAPDPDTYEGRLRPGLTPACEVPAARTRTDITPQMGYFPLDADTVAGVDAVLHVPG